MRSKLLATTNFTPVLLLADLIEHQLVEKAFRQPLSGPLRYAEPNSSFSSFMRSWRTGR
jgi:hypothetical protein